MTAASRLHEELRELPRRQTASLQHAGHRPWPRPRMPWLMGQSWCELLFAHWAVEPQCLAPFVPPPLSLQTHTGKAWVGVTPFLLRGLHARLLPPLPALSSFCEVNVRTYVTYGGKPGIFFLTLDANSAAAVFGGRVFAALPYRRAHITIERREGWTEYASTRPGFQLGARWAPHLEAFAASPGSLEHFLVERYCLYAVRASRLWRLEIHHGPWRLHVPAPGSHISAQLDSPALQLEGAPLLHVAAPQHVLLWAPTAVARLPERSGSCRGRSPVGNGSSAQRCTWRQLLGAQLHARAAGAVAAR